MISRMIAIALLVGCQTPEECPDPMCSPCPEVAIDYNDVAMEDCEQRLSECFDMKEMVDAELKVCKAKQMPKKKRKKK